jgi:hypothetical protein
MCDAWQSAMRQLWVALLIVMFTPSLAAACGEAGHKVVCEIAFRPALPGARAEIRRPMKGDERYDFLPRRLHLSGSSAHPRR